jgi:Flp pilus assembly pilin Flp
MQKTKTNPSWLARLRADQRGLTTVEYVIVLCLIAALSVATWTTFGETLRVKISTAEGKISGIKD